MRGREKAGAILKEAVRNRELGVAREHVKVREWAEKQRHMHCLGQGGEEEGIRLVTLPSLVLLNS